MQTASEGLSPTPSIYSTVAHPTVDEAVLTELAVSDKVARDIELAEPNCS